jgi:hypothetical protein
MARSYSELQDKDDMTALALAAYGLGRPTMSRAGWSPVGGGNGGHVEMAVSLISTRVLEVISNRSAGSLWPERFGRRILTPQRPVSPRIVHLTRAPKLRPEPGLQLPS